MGRGTAVRQAVAGLLRPDQHHLRLPADALAEAFLGLSRTAARTPGEEREPLPAEQVVDLFLHGAVTVPPGRSGSRSG
ncbi:hypothetical protein ACTOB_004055 [Actinoplanes oblitus]|uniref:Tetracyclin repressor-like C-terminal domain-containing protein n=1 Tax=Actinoplanes oblitus TaxID=3040509 RepID=A0ABY8WR12_9ACTN|nr:hypothetical protein [Actinoplanes oblitus]WIN00355.1 hypothetical protein ACTOB_004055 [Actinoplanes oblitus]